jgi:hypothetical protein
MEMTGCDVGFYSYLQKRKGNGFLARILFVQYQWNLQNPESKNSVNNTKRSTNSPDGIFFELTYPEYTKHSSRYKPKK